MFLLPKLKQIIKCLLYPGHKGADGSMMLHCVSLVIYKKCKNSLNKNQARLIVLFLWYFTPSINFFYLSVQLFFSLAQAEKPIFTHKLEEQLPINPCADLKV